MPPKQATDEDWSEQDLDMLLDLAFLHADESVTCHQTGAPLAAMVLLAAAFEAVLLGMVIAQENHLQGVGVLTLRVSAVTVR